MGIENSLWTEKYRPQKIEDCVFTSDVEKVFLGILEKKELPHLLLSGSAGVGKTTAAKALCNEFGYDVLVVNVSNDRGIDTLRTNITQFASSVSLMSDKKVVILDEADYATPLLQAALRNFMEEFSSTTRFILTCNYPNRIIDPIHSRCVCVDFTIKAKDKPQIAGSIMKRAIHILSSECVEFDRGALAKVVAKFFPDFRRTINELQRYSSIAGKIDESVIGATDSLEIKDFVSALKKKDFKSAKRWVVETLAVVDQNVAFRKIFDSLFDILEPTSIPAAILLIAQYQHKGVTTVDPEINFSAFCIECMSDLEFK